MTTFIETHARNINTGVGVNSATSTVKRHSDGSTVDSTTSSGAGADAGNIEYSEEEILYPGQFYNEITFNNTTKIQSSKVNGQLGPLRPNDVTRVIRAFGNGVVPDYGGELACTAAGTDMKVDIDDGFLLGGGQTYFRSVAQEATITTADLANPRIDVIVARLYGIDAADEDDVARVDIVVLAGTPAATPVAPTLTQDPATYWEEALVEVAVAAGVTTINTGNLTDRRRYAPFLPTGTNGQFLTLASGKPDWVTLTSTHVSDFEEAVEDLIGANLVAGAGISVTYDDPGTGRTTIAATGTGSSTITVQVGDDTIDGDASAVDFDGTAFTGLSQPAGEANIGLNFGTSAGQPAEGNHTHALPSHTHSAFQVLDLEASRDIVTDGTVNVISTSGQAIFNDSTTLSNGVTYDILITAHAQLNAPSGNWIQARLDLSGTGITGEIQPWQGTGTVGGERSVWVYAILRNVSGTGQTLTATLQAKVTGGTGSVATAAFAGFAFPRGSGGVA